MGEVLTDHAGADLSGNTYWEFKDALNSNRFRRIVRYNPKAQYADIKITRTFPDLIKLKPPSTAHLSIRHNSRD